jgi:Tol biopolymer transport system component
LRRKSPHAGAEANVGGVRSASGLAAAVTLSLTANGPQSLVTVPQGDRGRTLIGSSSADVSGDGRFVAFESFARLVPADTDSSRDVYVLDRTTGQVTLETGGLTGWRDGGRPRLGRDGRWLVFEAEAMTGDDRIVRVDIVVVDRTSGRIVAVRAADGGVPSGSSYSPDISDDGRVVAFSSAATNLVSGPDANGPLEDIYLFDVPSGSVRRISLTTAGVQPASGFSFSPTVSADGRAIAFTSSALLSDVRRSSQTTDSNLRQIYLREDRQGTTTLISVGAGGSWPDGASARPAISGDGRYIAFTSDATNIVKDDRNRVADVFLHDRGTAKTTIISRATDGVGANGRSTSPAISYDGRFVAFQSDASNLTCGRKCASTHDLNLLWDVFVWDRETKANVRVSDDPLGGWNAPSVGPALDRHGGIVAFTSRHPMDASDRANDFDLFVRDLSDALPTR